MNEWKSRAACGDAPDPEIFFDPHGHIADALAYCNRCPVVAECVETARDEREHGIWGGLLWTGTGRPARPPIRCQSCRAPIQRASTGRPRRFCPDCSERRRNGAAA
jgi:hypothetical protein